MGKLVNLEETSIDKIDNIIVEFPTVERLLEGVIKVFLQFDSEYLIIPMECMPIYGIILELDSYIDSKRNPHPLTYVEKEWIFEHKQMWEHERELAAVQGHPPVRFFTNQPNEIRDNLIRKPSINTNSMSVSPQRRIIRNSQLEKRHEEKKEKEVKKLSEKLNNQTPEV
jgi:hypothetical protein